jgi:site-specific DNA-methyltransferase (adenine-specific)
MDKIQENQVYCMDALELLKKLPDNYADLILTDPPYGIKADKGDKGIGIAPQRKYNDEWDGQTPKKEVFDEILRVGKKAIIFGGNFFTDKIPRGSHWIVWDKIGNHKFKSSFGDVELAWTNFTRKSSKKYIVVQHGFVSEERSRQHPTQKPVALFIDIINDYSEKGDLILDCYIGSGTTAVACKKIGRRFIGCDILQKYVDITNRRLKNPWI